ncbi:MAG: hypothetical protein KZQ58_00410 [gamma proteobacterium symbiont of Bathyaustriella thionipta]|nr:hypothetical protein [gamma proteobacterium symbiont of Bathyaustriella thionipta]
MRIYQSEGGIDFIQLCDIRDDALRGAFKKWLTGQTVPQHGQAYVHDGEAFLNTLAWMKLYPDPLEREKAQTAYILDSLQKHGKDYE